MSASTFSSRERDERLDQLFELAALQRDLGHARLEQRHLGGGIARAVLRLAWPAARASVACVWLSCWRRTSSCSSVRTRCCGLPGDATARRSPAAPAARSTTTAQRGKRGRAQRRLGRRASDGVSARGEFTVQAIDVAHGAASIVSTGPIARHGCGAAPRCDGAEAAARARARRCAGAWPARARAATPPAAAGCAVGDRPRELLKQPQVLLRPRERRRQPARCCSALQVRQRARVGAHEARPARRRRAGARPASRARRRRARPAPRACAQVRSRRALPQRLGVELRRLGGRLDDLRRRDAGSAQRLRRAGPGASRPARRPARRSPAAAARRNACTAFGLTNTTSRMRSQRAQRRVTAAASAARRDLRSAAAPARVRGRARAAAHPGIGLRLRPRDEHAHRRHGVVQAAREVGVGALLAQPRGHLLAAARALRPLVVGRHGARVRRSSGCARVARHGRARRRSTSSSPLPRARARPAACCSCRRARATPRARPAPRARSGGAISGASVPRSARRIGAHLDAQRALPRGTAASASGSKRARMRSASPSRIKPGGGQHDGVVAGLRRACAAACRGCRAAARCAGRAAARASCTTRRRLEVPTRAPCGSSRQRRVARSRRRRRAGPRARAPRPARSPAAGPSARPSANAPRGAARPSSSAVSSSLTNRPLPPTLDSVRSRIWSPRVVMPSSSTCRPKRARSSARTCSACHSARRLSRVAMMRIGCGHAHDVAGASQRVRPRLASIAIGNSITWSSALPCPRRAPRAPPRRRSQAPRRAHGRRRRGRRTSRWSRTSGCSAASSAT